MPVQTPPRRRTGRETPPENRVAGAGKPLSPPEREMAKAATPPGLSEAVLQRVLAHIQAHLDAPLQLADLAAVAFLSRFHFARLFRRSTGMSPMVYVLHARLHEAQRRLAVENRRVADIAVELGFFDQSHFARSFRRVVGVPPGRFARSARRDRTTTPSPSVASNRFDAASPRAVITHRSELAL